MTLTSQQMAAIKRAVYACLLVILGVVFGEETTPMQSVGLKSADPEKVESFTYQLPAGTLTFAPSVPDVPDPITPTPVIPPSPESGVRVVTIYRESADQTPELGLLVIDLQDPQSVACKWFREHGHPAPTVIDDNGESRLVIKDASGAVLFDGPIPPTADGVVEKVMQTGG